VLVGLLGMPVRLAAPNIDEQAYLLPDPTLAAINVAAAKARALVSEADEVVLAADTLVVCDGDVLGKPEDAEEAERMLRRLRGRSHQVLTAVALRASSGLAWCGVVATGVLMRAYADDEVAQYIERSEPFDKAGGYAVQDEVFRPVERLEGCYLNVVGLPLCAVAAGLLALGEASARPGGVPPCGYCRAGAAVVSIRSGN
jgi:MAF protein